MQIEYWQYFGPDNGKQNNLITRLLIQPIAFICTTAHSNRYCCIILQIQIPLQTAMRIATATSHVPATNIVTWRNTSATAQTRLTMDPVPLSEMCAPRAVADGTFFAPVRSVNTTKSIQYPVR